MKNPPPQIRILVLLEPNWAHTIEMDIHILSEPSVSSDFRQLDLIRCFFLSISATAESKQVHLYGMIPHTDYGLTMANILFSSFEQPTPIPNFRNNFFVYLLFEYYYKVKVLNYYHNTLKNANITLLYIKKIKTLCNTLNSGNWNSGFVKLVVRWAERDIIV